MNIGQAALEYLRRQSKTWDIDDAVQLVEMAGPPCCPPIYQRARMSHEARRSHLRRIDHVAKANGHSPEMIKMWLKLPPSFVKQVTELLALTERAGVTVTDEMLKGWVKELKKTLNIVQGME